MSEIIGCFPVTAAKVELAREVCADDSTPVIGVTISILVLREHIHELPDMFRRLAEGQLYRHAVEGDK